MDTIFRHRSIRKYRTTPVKVSIVEHLIRAGSRASTTGNMQVYSIIVTKDKTMKEKLWELHFKQDMVRQAPLVFTFCADFSRFSTWCNYRKANPGYDNYLSFFTGAIDALLASQNLALAAEENGLGICYLGTTTYNADKIIELLKLPKLVVPVATIVAGYPDEEPDLTDRLPLDAIVHKETYKEYTEADIYKIYHQREESNETKKLLEINNKETLAQIFTDNRYTKKDNILFSKKFLKVLKDQGFMENE